jgi:hypothetical protein
MVTHQDAIEKRCGELFESFISANDYFDYERGVLWMLNSAREYPTAARQDADIRLGESVVTPEVSEMARDMSGPNNTNWKGGRKNPS